MCLKINSVNIEQKKNKLEHNLIYELSVCVVYTLLSILLNYLAPNFNFDSLEN